MAEALKWTVLERKEHERHYLTLRDRLLEAIPAQIPDARLTGDPIKRLPNHASFVFRDLDGNQLLAALDLQGFGCSSGSACKTGEPEPSKVLQALGIEADWSLGSLRVTLGRPTTSDEIDSFLDTLPGVVDRLRAAVEVNP
jgi:cysteine desulfurase